MKKKALLLALGILGICQLGYSENLDTTVERIQNVETEKNQNEVNLDETIKTEAEEEIEVALPEKEIPKQPKVTPAQQKKIESKAKKNKEKNMSLDEKLDLQILRMERMLKSLDGR